MTIRTAGPADIETLIELRFAFLREFRNIDDATKQTLRPQLESYFARHIGADDFHALLAEQDGEVQSTAFYTVSESPPNDQYPNGKIAYVFNVYTRPQHRGKGCAPQLMQALIAAAKQRGVTAINLNASAAGRPIYEKVGFKVLSDTAMRLQLH